MGWCSGTEVAEKWLAQIQKNPKKHEHREAIIEMIEALEDQDWDCQDDLSDPEFELVWAEYRHKKWGSDD